MLPRSADEADYAFLTAPGAILRASIAEDEGCRPELRLFGNRAGILSLTNILLWLVANASRRESLSLGELGFVTLSGSLAVSLRMTAEDPTGRDGRVVRLDRGDSLEWSVTEDDLGRVAHLAHRLACNPCHEYDRLLVDEASGFGIHIRMTDAASWLATNLASP